VLIFRWGTSKNKVSTFTLDFLTALKINHGKQLSFYLQSLIQFLIR